MIPSVGMSIADEPYTCIAKHNRVGPARELQVYKVQLIDLADFMKVIMFVLRFEQ